MASNIEIKGNNSFDELKRKKAIESILDLKTEELERLASLKNSPKARTYLSSETKFKLLKNFL